MNKTILAILALVVVFLMGCQPAMQPAAEPAPAAPAPEPAAPAAEPAAPAPEPAAEGEAETTPAPMENVAAPSEGVDLGSVCYDLISEEEFNEICGREGELVLTHKISEGSCWINVADHFNNRMTAGVTVKDWGDADEADSEFDRGVNMRRTQGAEESQDVGQRSYQFQEIGRNNLVWTNGQYLGHLGVMTDLCAAEHHVALGQKINSRLG